MRNLRDYQQQAHKEIYAAWAAKERPLLVMPPGAGKSFTIARLIRQVHGVYRVNLVVRKRDLVEQLERDIKEEGVPYGVYMSGHPKYDPRQPVQVCSIDTLRARKDYPHLSADKTINFIDEADQSLSASYQDFINAYPQALLGGMTATPYNGLHHFNRLVMPITVKALLERGILVPFRYFIPEGAIDMRGAGMRAGEYTQSAIDARVNTLPAVTSVVRAWEAWGDNRLTLGFASSVASSKLLTEAFNRHYGRVIAVHMDAQTSKSERAFLISEFRCGKVLIIFQVGLMGRGTDIPEIGCCLDVAPTARMNNHEQKMGRGARANALYKDCIWIDCAKNTPRLGPYNMDRSGLINLTRPTKFSAAQLIELELMKRCERCFGAFEPSDFKDGLCPGCGHYNFKVTKKRIEKNFQTVEVQEALLAQQRIINEFKKEVWKRENLPFFKSRYRQYDHKVRRAIIIKAVHHILWGRYKYACYDVAGAIKMNINEWGA